MAKLSDIKQEQSVRPAVGPAAQMLTLPEETKKDKQVTMRINSGLYADYSQICKALGATNNGMLTMLIKKFVNENKELLK